MRTKFWRAGATLTLCAASILSLSACSSDVSQAQSEKNQKAEIARIVKLIPASQRGSVVVTGVNGSNKEGQYLQCNDTTAQFLTGRLVNRTGGIAAQKYINTTIKSKLETDGYKTSYYTAEKPAKLIADKDGYEIWVSAGTDKKAVIFTSFGRCFDIQTSTSPASSPATSSPAASDPAFLR